MRMVWLGVCILMSALESTVSQGPPTLRSSGIFHPYLHLRYAFEFNQPAIVAEALAMAAVHDPEGEKAAAFFTKVEMLAGGPGQQGERGFHDIIEDMRQNKTLTNNIYGRGKINKAPDVADGAPGIVKYLSQYSIPDAQLEEELDEMIDTSCTGCSSLGQSFDLLAEAQCSTVYGYQAVTH